MALLIGPTALAAVGEDKPAPEPLIQAPGILISGQGEWLWLVWLGEGGDGKSEQPPTRILPREASRPWLPAQRLQLKAVRTVAAQGNRLHVFLPDRRHFIYDDQQKRHASILLPDDWLALESAADETRLFVLATRRPPATTQPEAAPASGPAGAVATSAPEQPTTQPERPGRLLRLFMQQRGDWQAQPALPAQAAGADQLSLAVHLRKPTLLYLVGGELFGLKLEGGAWSSIGPPGPGGLPQPLGSADPDGPVPPLVDLFAASVNQQLYVVGWPRQAGIPLRIGRVADGQVKNLDELPLQPMPGPGYRRHRDWDLTADNQWLIFLRKVPQGEEPAELMVRRFDPQSRKFDSDWQRVPLVEPSPWPGITQHPLFHVVLVALLVALFLMRRPRGVIRIPADTEPAGLPQRLAAFFIDLAPCLVGGYLLVYGPSAEALQRFEQVVNYGQGDDPQLIRFVFTALGVFLGYLTLAEGLLQTTVGKRLFRLKVRSVHGERVTLVQALVRNAVKGIEMPLIVPLVLVFIHPVRMRLGDMVAGTVVVGPRRPGSLWIRPPTSAGTDEPPRPPDDNESH